MDVSNVTRKATKTRRKSSPRPALSQWIGQLAEEPGVWFLVWAPTRRAARDMVTRDIGAVAPGSIKQVNGPGYFLFRATVKRTPSLPLAELQPPTGEYLILYDPPSEAWIVKRLSEAGDASPTRTGAGSSRDERVGAPARGKKENEIPIRVERDAS
jgi:hypothetical protein